MIKLACVQEPGVLEIIERDQPQLGEDAVRLKIEAVGICGSDVALMAGTHPYAIYPVVPGHELAGRVLETSDMNKVQVGQLVAVRPTLSCGKCSACIDHRPNHCADVRVLGVHLDGGMADEMVVPLDLVYPASGEMSADHAAIVEPTAVAVHACHRSELSSGMSLAIIGSGVIDAVEGSRELRPDGFDVVMDMVGRAETLVDAAEMARRGGTIVPVALPHGAINYDFELLYRKELSIVGSRLYNGDFEEALELIASGDVNPDPIITHQFPLEEASSAFSTLVDHPDQAIKILVLP
jgi:threonine dehydrogenase-like Zn-dependent dehydrogenase